jgi:hypothetical protein
MGGNVVAQLTTGTHGTSHTALPSTSTVNTYVWTTEAQETYIAYTTSRQNGDTHLFREAAQSTRPLRARNRYVSPF